MDGGLSSFRLSASGEQYLSFQTPVIIYAHLHHYQMANTKQTAHLFRSCHPIL